MDDVVVVDLVSSDNEEEEMQRRVAVAATATFYSLTPELQLHVAEFLPVRDLLNYQCTSKELSNLNTDSIWKVRCEQRWEPWPRYRLTKQRHTELSSTLFQLVVSWQQRYMAIEQDATRTTLQLNDLHELKWNLTFVLSGVRGEGRSDHMEVQFVPRRLVPGSGYLHVPGYPPLPYQIMDEFPVSSNRGRGHPGDHDNYVTSTQQHLQISNFPPHYITRRRSDAGWLIYNENVNIVSCGKR